MGGGLRDADGVSMWHAQNRSNGEAMMRMLGFKFIRGYCTQRAPAVLLSVPPMLSSTAPVYAARICTRNRRPQ